MEACSHLLTQQRPSGVSEVVRLPDRVVRFLGRLCLLVLAMPGTTTMLRFLDFFSLGWPLFGEGGLAYFDPECLHLGSEALPVLRLGSGLAACDATVGLTLGLGVMGRPYGHPDPLALSPSGVAST